MNASQEIKVNGKVGAMSWGMADLDKDADDERFELLVQLALRKSKLDGSTSVESADKEETRLRDLIAEAIKLAPENKAKIAAFLVLFAAGVYTIVQVFEFLNFLIN